MRREVMPMTDLTDFVKLLTALVSLLTALIGLIGQNVCPDKTSVSIH